MQVWYKQKSRFWYSWLSKIARRAKCQKHSPTTKLSIWQSATHHWLSIDCCTCELRSEKSSYRRPCNVDRTVGDAPSNVCFVTACSMDQCAEEKRTEKNLILRMVYLKPKLIIKDCARRFVLKLYWHEAPRGFFATAELLVDSVSLLNRERLS